MVDASIGKILKRVLLVAVAASAVEAWGQEEPRRTPLGTQTTFPVERLREAQKERERNRPPTVTPEPLERAMERAETVHGGRQALMDVADSIAEGVFTRLSANGESRNFALTLVGKGADQVQRVIPQSGGELRQGSDGNSTWDGVAGHYTSVRGPVLSFVETRTARSVLSFFDHRSRGARSKDLGMEGARRVVEVEDANGRATTYYLEPSGHLARLEFIDGQGVHMLTGKALPTVQSYEFSDYRMIQGVLTPMKIEHFTNGMKIDITALTSVRYNTGVPDSVFQR